MKSTPFNPGTDYAPIPFSAEICQLAQKLKNKGLPWQPHVGCFVWDEQNNIEVPSPFPGNIYFILNLNHFLKIFGTVERMKSDLVWLPTWQQAKTVLNEMKRTDLGITSQLQANLSLATLYKYILDAL